MSKQRNRLLLTALIALAVLGVGMYLAPTLAGALAQGQATSPVGGSVAVASDATERTIEEMQARIAASKQDYQAYGNLGLAFLQKARETNDPTYYTQAEQAFNAALVLQPNYYDAIAGFGSLELSRHEFAKALDWGKKAIALNRYKSYAYGVQGDAQIELGQYESAVDTFQQMVDLRPDLSSYSRVSYARELYGDVPGAIEAMQQAVDAGSPAAENTSWTRVQLGNLYFNSKQLDKAEAQYKTALAAYPNYLHALAGLAQMAAARGNMDEAIKLYKQSIDIVPLPQYLTALGDLYTFKGDSRAAKEQYDLVLYIYKLFEANGVNADAEKAAFLADRNTETGEAVKLARQAANERNDLHTLDTLAWALY